MTGACSPSEGSRQQDISQLKSLHSSTTPIPGGTYLLEAPEGAALIRNGVPFPIKGACVQDNFSSLAASGGNTIRLYTPRGLDTLLDKAHQEGLAVMVGLHMMPARQGFNYFEEELVAAQEAALLDTVRKYRDHPALLMWNLGNEINLIIRDKIVWKAVESLASKIKVLDPHHPTTISVHGSELMVEQVAGLCPSLDVLSLNLFGALDKYIRLLNRGKLGWKKPYIITEWGNRGYWETTQTNWDAPIEPMPTDKMYQLSFNYHHLMDSGRNSLGGYVFLWGQKQERTHSWFSLFDKDGNKTPAVDELQQLWTGQVSIDHAPIIEALTLNDQIDQASQYLEAGGVFEAEVFIREPEGQPITINWELLPEGDYRTTFGGDKEQRPLPVPGSVLKQDSLRMQGLVPEQIGAYRLFVEARDPQGAVSTANFPFFVHLPSTNIGP